MFNKVAWATDGSRDADHALPVARALATEGGKQLLVIHCVEFTAPSKGGGPFPAYVNEDDLQAKINEQVAELSRDGMSTKLEMIRTGTGGAAHVITDVAKDAGADVIVVGTRGHTKIGGLLLGSVTQRLLHIAHCPVLAVPDRDSRAAGE